jgi:hypothetical protein
LAVRENEADNLRLDAFYFDAPPREPKETGKVPMTEENLPEGSQRRPFITVEPKDSSCP